MTERGGVKKRTAETVFGDRDFAPSKLRETVKIAGAPNDGSESQDIFLCLQIIMAAVYTHKTIWQPLNQSFWGFLRAFFQKRP